MTVRAGWTGAFRGNGASLDQALAAAGAFLVAMAAIPAQAQVSGSVDVESDYRLRGYSLSAGRPVATAQIGYDDDSGVYFNLSATGELGRDDDPRFLGVQGNIGYARKLNQKLSIDAGVVRNQYRAAYPGVRSNDYTEMYLGVAADSLSARIYYSPDFRPGVATVYGEVEATIRPANNWRLNGHLGGLVYVTTTNCRFRSDPKYDWRLGVARQFGSLDLHTALSGGGSCRGYYGGSARNKTALTAGASWSF